MGLLFWGGGRGGGVGEKGWVGLMGAEKEGVRTGHIGNTLDRAHR